MNGISRIWRGFTITTTARVGDLEKLEQISAGYATRERFLTELTLDPPEATGAEAGAPLLDEDYLILSTIHSAKGQEWDVVFILNVADGCIPSDMATGSPEQIEEERRVLGVAMTRAKIHLHLIQPLRFFRSQQHRLRRRLHVLAAEPVHSGRHPQSVRMPGLAGRDSRRHASAPEAIALATDVAARMREMWRWRQRSSEVQIQEQRWESKPQIARISQMTKPGSRSYGSEASLLYLELMLTN